MNGGKGEEGGKGWKGCMCVVVYIPQVRKIVTAWVMKIIPAAVSILAASLATEQLILTIVKGISLPVSY